MLNSEAPKVRESPIHCPGSKLNKAVARVTDVRSRTIACSRRLDSIALKVIPHAES